MKLRLLDLFSGIGGFSLGLEQTGGFETVAFCEVNPARRADLKKYWQNVPSFEDVQDLSADDLVQIDAISAGFPCQDISAAGRKAGIHGERTGLFSEVIRLTRDLRPEVVFLENSADLLTGGRGGWAAHVFGELAALGYNAEWHVIPLAGLGAPHVRERVYIIATDACRPIWRDRESVFLGRRGACAGEAAAVVADDYRLRKLQPGWVFKDKRGRIVHDPESAWPETWNEKLSSLCSMDDGIPAGLASAAAERFGNAVSPAVIHLLGTAFLSERRARLEGAA